MGAATDGAALRTMSGKADGVVGGVIGSAEGGINVVVCDEGGKAKGGAVVEVEVVVVEAARGIASSFWFGCFDFGLGATNTSLSDQENQT
jgi:hypothetical protein